MSELHSLNTEKYIIKVMYNRAKSIVELSQKLKPNDFYYEGFRYLFTAIKKLSNQGDVTPEGIMTLLENENQKAYEMVKGNGGISFLETFKDDSLPPSPSVDEQVKTMKSFAYRRNTKDAATKIQAYALTNYDPDTNSQFETVEQLDERVKEIVNSLAVNLRVQQESKPIGSKVDDLISRIKDKDDSMLGIDIGHKYPMFNRMIKRLQSSRVIVIAAEEKAAKSTFMLDIAATVADSGKPVLFGDSEMSEDEVIIRLLSKYTGLSQDYIREGKFIGNPEQEKIVETAENIIEQLPLYWENMNYMSNSEMESTVKLYQLKHGIEFFVWDYIKIGGEEGDKARLDKIMASKINLAKEKLAKNCNIPVLTAAQKNPNTGKIADSHDLNRIADAIIDWKKLGVDELHMGTHSARLSVCRYGQFDEIIYFDIDGSTQVVKEV